MTLTLSAATYGANIARSALRLSRRVNFFTKCPGRGFACDGGLSHAFDVAVRGTCALAARIASIARVTAATSLPESTNIAPQTASTTVPRL